MKRAAFFVLGLFVAGGVTAAAAPEPVALAGTLDFGTATLVDPDPAEPPDRALIYLDGAAARALYLKLPQAAKPDACDEELLTKRAGELSCSLDPGRKEYSCSIGLLLRDGKPVPASTC